MTRPGWRCNLSEMLIDERLDRFGSESALRFPDGEWTYEELATRVASLAHGLADFGVVPRRRVALVLPDSPLWVAAFLALTRLGAEVALASPTMPAEHLSDALDRAHATILITDDEDLLPGLSRIDTLMLERLVEVTLPDPGPAPTRSGDPCYMLLTSGSTGPPKWAIHGHGDIPACIATYGRHVLRLGPGDVTWSVAALPTSYGLGNTLYFPLGAGAATWMTGAHPTPAEAARACEQGRANVMFGVPTFWARLARHVDDGRLPVGAFAQVRLAVSAGEPLPDAVWHLVRDVLGFELVDGLGSSEATNLYISNRPGHARPGSVGTVVPGYEVRVVGEDGNRLDPGEPGELLVRGPTVMAGYLDAPDATAQVLTDGWLHTGDVVVRAADAGYRFVGRLGERFKSGGLWVDPARVEAVLQSHPAVSEVAVTGALDEFGIARVVALVVARDGAGGGDLRIKLESLATSELAPHEVPRNVVFVEHLPTAASGKVRRMEVSRIAKAALAAGGVRR